MKKKKLLKSIRFQVMAVFVILILPLNILSVYQLKSVMDQSVEQIKMAGKEIVSMYANTLMKKMENSATLLHHFMIDDSDCIRMISGRASVEEYEISKLKLYYKIRDMAEMTEGADGYFFYMPETEDLLYYQEENRDEGKEIIQDMISDNKLDPGWHIYKENGSKIILSVRLRGVQYGACINLDFLTEHPADVYLYKDSYFEMKDGQGSSKYEDGEWITASAEVRNMDLTMYIEKKDKIFNSLWKQKIAVMTFVYLLLIPILYFVIYRLVILPLYRVEEAHRQLGLGNRNYRISKHAISNEFEKVNDSFNKMADRIHTLTIKEYENEVYKAKMELQNLQLQIRPHFLQNTFNLIYQLSQREENETVQKIILYLSEYFRCIFREGNKGIIFCKELKLIEQYVQVASVRYDGLVELETDIDPEVETVRVPPLLLHNFVENAVKYGIRPGKMLYIYMEGRYDMGRVVFTIADNGNGMSQDILERNRKILKGEETKEDMGQHLGLYNSIRRIKAFYGEEVNINVESEEGKMTSFTITFPYDLEVKE